jgi:hypothetical protein
MKHNLNFKLRILSLSLLSAACSENVAFDKVVNPSTVCESGCDPVSGLFEVEDFTQVDRAAKVDILFVVDNSPSMYVEQRMLGQRFRSFISALNTVDWQIAFTTTDVSNGSFGIKGSLLDLDGMPGSKILTSATPNLDRVFQRTVQRSESNCSFDCPTSDEQGLLATIMAMEKSLTVNRSFFRENVDVAVIYISDEDEMSTGPRDATKPIEVLNSFQNLWGSTKSLVSYGIVIQPGDVDCLADKRDEGTTAYYGTHVTELAALTGGLTGSLCQADYSQTLEEIGRGVRSLVDVFELKSVPNGEVKVELNPHQDITWSMDGKKLKFSQPPRQGTKIRVTYPKA